MYLTLSELTATHRALLAAPDVGAATVMFEHDRSAMTRPARFAVDLQAGLAWAWVRNSELVSAAQQEGSLVLEQRSQGWMLRFAGAAQLCEGPELQRALDALTARFPDTAPAPVSFQVRIHRCFALETHLPLKRWA